MEQEGGSRREIIPLVPHFTFPPCSREEREIMWIERVVEIRYVGRWPGREEWINWSIFAQ